VNEDRENEDREDEDRNIGELVWRNDSNNVCSDPIIVTEVRISEVAVVVCLRLNESNDTDNRKENYNSCFEILAKRLRETGDLCASFGLTLPVVGIVELKEDDDKFKEAVEEKAGDQDWHRGDFVLLCARSDEIIQEVERVLGGIDQVLSSPYLIKPMDNDALLTSIESELKTRSNLSAVQRSLIEVIRDSVAHNMDVEQAVLKWTEEYLDMGGNEK